MNDAGYNVFWNEPKLDGTPQGAAERRHFVSKVSADTFAATLPESKRPRVLPARLAPADALDFWKLEQERITNGTADANASNRRRLVELMLEHDITIPAKQFDNWRPTELKTGHIPGVCDGLTCIMTDGMLGYFTREGREPLYGHVGSFIWDTPETTMFGTKDRGAPPPYFKRPAAAVTPKATKKPKTPKVHVPMTAASALDLIKRMTEGMKA